MTHDDDRTALETKVHEDLRSRGFDGEAGPLETMPGGHSGLTYRLTMGTASFVVKAVPPGQRPIGRHDMVRQARMISALAATDVPVPVIHAQSDEVPAWFAMELVEGESLEPVLDDPEVPAELAASRMRRAAQILPLLHEVPLASLPIDNEPLTPAGELGRWVRTLAAVPPELVPDAGRLQELLERTIPEPVHPVLVHGDYRLGNLISRGEEPVALIDWEIWGPGDPRVELGWFLVFADGSNFPGVGRMVDGLPSADELIGEYANRRGELADFTWFDALGRYKMAAIMGHNLRRHREGRHVDPAQEQLPDTISRLLETGIARLS